MALVKGNARSSSALDATVLTGNLPAISGASLTGISAGITMADTWRLTASFTGAASPIASNWERADDATSGFIGTGMTESSGVFTFPQTGIYQVQYWITYYLNADTRHNNHQIFVSSNSGGAYDSVAESNSFVAVASSNNTHATTNTMAVVDVTSASNFRVRFHTSYTSSSTTTWADSGSNYTYVQFLRLGDT